MIVANPCRFRTTHPAFAEAFEKLEQEMESLIGNDRLQSLSDTFEPPPRHIVDHEFLVILVLVAWSFSWLWPIVVAKAVIVGKQVGQFRWDSEHHVEFDIICTLKEKWEHWHELCMMSDDMMTCYTLIRTSHIHIAQIYACPCVKRIEQVQLYIAVVADRDHRQNHDESCGRRDELEQPRPLKPLPFQAKATVAVGGGPAQVDGKPVLDKRPKSNLDDNDVKVLDFRLMSPGKPKQLPERLNTNELMSWYIYFACLLLPCNDAQGILEVF